MNRDIAYYELIQARPSELDEKLRIAIQEDGLQPFGSPFVIVPGWIGQAIVRYEA